MNPRTTGLLALAAAILGGFIYFYEIEGESSRLVARDEEKRIFPGLVAADVDGATRQRAEPQIPGVRVARDQARLAQVSLQQPLQLRRRSGLLLSWRLRCAWREQDLP